MTHLLSLAVPAKHAYTQLTPLCDGCYLYTDTKLTPHANTPSSFERPSAIQQRAIVPCTKGQDVIAQAQSGTGKTATFTISVLQSIDMSVRRTQALILGPTRELAQQIQKVSVVGWCWSGIRV